MKPLAASVDVASAGSAVVLRGARRSFPGRRDLVLPSPAGAEASRAEEKLRGTVTRP